MRYKTIVTDPPWMESGGGKIKRGADRHYQLMKTDDIINLHRTFLCDKIADDCHLYVWVTNNHLQDGFKLIEALGFRYVTMITWVKDRFGLGQYYRGQTEHILFAVKGMVPYKIINGKRQQGVTVLYADRGKHSEKPQQMYDMIQKVSTGPMLEMFARKQREGFDVWGNEV